MQEAFRSHTDTLNKNNGTASLRVEERHHWPHLNTVPCKHNTTGEGNLTRDVTRLRSQGAGERQRHWRGSVTWWTLKWGVFNWLRNEGGGGAAAAYLLIGCSGRDLVQGMFFSPSKRVDRRGPLLDSCCWNFEGLEDSGLRIRSTRIL